MPFFHQTANPEAVLRQFLNLLGLSVSKEQLTNEISIHPDYPNLLALNDVANNFGAAANAYRISADDLMEVPCPFIAHTRKKGSQFMLVTAINENEITLTDHLRKNYKTKLSDFTSIFNDVVLIAETVSETAKIASPFKLLSDENKTAIAFFLAFACLAFAIGQHFIPAVAGWILPVVALLKTAGLAVSVLLLIQSIDKNNPLVQTLCGGGGKTNCNAILTSKAANAFEGLTWSEVGFFYFTGTWLAVLFGGGNLALLQLLAVLNIISLPYTFYSIYYQWRIAKQWCVFCCAVQALLWLEFIPLVSVLGQPFQVLNVSGVIGLLIFLGLPVAAWWVLKPLILKVQQLQPLKTQLQKVKYNIQQFNRLLQEQPKYALPAEEWSIVLGNVEAGNVITIVTNPYCQPCVKTHNLLDSWLNNHLDIQFRIVFTADNNEDDIKTPVARHLMALNELPEKDTVKRALHNWYNQKQKNYQAWARAYPVSMDETKFDKLDKQKEWCEMAEVKATPTLFVNGYRLPGEYRLHDIKYLLVQQ